MPKAPPTPPNEGQEAKGRGTPPLDVAIRTGVLATLGSPPGLYRLAVLPLWKSYFRVNVLTGSDATTVRVAHSYFVEATDGGEIVSAKPPIVRQYP